jgi:hypothetical protein
MPLMRIADLDQPAEYKAQYVQHAMRLSMLWHQWKLQHDESLDFHVRKPPNKARPPGLHASEVSGCPRRLVYALRNEQKVALNEEKDVNMQNRFTLGTVVHELIQWEFGKMCDWLNQGGKQLTFEPEVKVSPELGGVAQQYGMMSSCDGCFTFWVPVTHEVYEPYMRVALEIKTASDKEYEKLTEPKLEHKEQTCFYMRALDIPLMWTLYYNKSSSHTTGSEAPWLFQFDQHLWSTKLEPRIVTAYNYVAQQQLPAKQEGRPCGWCPYAHTCQPSYLKSGRVGYVPSPREL